MSNNNEKTKISEQAVIVEALRMKDEGKLLHQIIAVFPEHEKEIRELFGVVAYIKIKRNDFEPKTELLLQTLKKIDISMQKEKDMAVGQIKIAGEDKNKKIIVIEDEDESAPVFLKENDFSSEQGFFEKIAIFFKTLSPVLTISFAVVIVLIFGFYYQPWFGAKNIPQDLSSNDQGDQIIGIFADELNQVTDSIQNDLNKEVEYFQNGIANTSIATSDQKFIDSLTTSYNENNF